MLLLQLNTTKNPPKKEHFLANANTQKTKKIGKRKEKTLKKAKKTISKLKFTKD